MFNLQTSPDTGNATSSPASPVGPLQLDLLGGPTTASSGPAAPRASRSPSRVKEKPRMTIGTCGPTSFASSVPDGPLSSWENRLRRRLARTGSTECLLTWKQRTTPAGRSLSQLVPSTRPIAGTGSGLWPTPTTRDWKDSPGMSFAPRKDGASRLDLLPRQVYWIAQNTPAALWPTPCARDHMPAHSPEYIAEKKAQGHGMSILPDYAATALWGTPLAQQANGEPEQFLQRKRDSVARGNSMGISLSDLNMQVKAAHGPGRTGSSATTEKPGALNPAFVCWLMGFPAAWDACAPTAMPSSRKSRPK